MAEWEKWSIEDLKKTADLLSDFVEELEFDISVDAFAEAISKLTPEERTLCLNGTPEERNRIIRSKMQ